MTSYKKQELLNLHGDLGSPPIFLGSPPVLGGVGVAHLCSFQCFALFVFALCLVCQMLAVSLHCPKCWQCLYIVSNVGSVSTLSQMLAVSLHCLKCWQCLYIVPNVGSVSTLSQMLAVSLYCLYIVHFWPALRFSLTDGSNYWIKFDGRFTCNIVLKVRCISFHCLLCHKWPWSGYLYACIRWKQQDEKSFSMN